MESNKDAALIESVKCIFGTDSSVASRLVNMLSRRQVILATDSLDEAEKAIVTFIKTARKSFGYDISIYSLINFTGHNFESLDGIMRAMARPLPVPSMDQLRQAYGRDGGSQSWQRIEEAYPFLATLFCIDAAAFEVAAGANQDWNTRSAKIGSLIGELRRSIEAEIERLKTNPTSLEIPASDLPRLFNVPERWELERAYGTAEWLDMRKKYPLVSLAFQVAKKATELNSMFGMGADANTYLFNELKFDADILVAEMRRYPASDKPAVVPGGKRRPPTAAQIRAAYVEKKAGNTAPWKAWDELFPAITTAARSLYMLWDGIATLELDSEFDNYVPHELLDLRDHLSSAFDNALAAAKPV